MTTAQNFPSDARPHIYEPLVKAKQPPKDLGTWSGLRIIAIGPKGGKIVGYTSSGKPIYAGSGTAIKLAKEHAQAKAEKAKAENVKSWLVESLGFPAVIGPDPDSISVAVASAEILEKQFGIKPKLVGTKLKSFKVKDLKPHVGKPLTPKTPEEAATFAAKAGAGELDKDPFPPLIELKKDTTSPEAKAVMGTLHENYLYRDSKGNKFVFKTDPTNQLIPRAEEAADRISRLILGPDNAPAAKHVIIDGKPGVLLTWVEGKVLNPSNHNNPPTDILQKHFDDVVANHIVDWLVSNHDGHAANFMANDKGLATFDKGQAWKFFDTDKLSDTYSPNPSDPIYVKFWKLFQAEMLKGDPVEAAKKTINHIETLLTPDQFRQIVMPYAIEAAKIPGQKKSADQLADEYTARLTNLRKDWEEFLSKMMGKKVVLEKEHDDNFETMPESDIVEPGATGALPEQPKAPIQTEETPGWPQTKGKITIFNPGTAPEANLKWPKGYPGPGFQAQVSYKKQTYTVEFKVVGPNKVPRFVVYYPDGTSKAFESPNAASDSLVLFQKNLQLDLNATQKKKLGISFPAKKAFGVSAFAKELEEAHAAIEEELKEATSTTPTPSDDNWLTMPPNNKYEWKLELNKYTIGTKFRIKFPEDDNYTFYEKQPNGMWKVWPVGAAAGSKEMSAGDIANVFAAAAANMDDVEQAVKPVPAPKPTPSVESQQEVQDWVKHTVTGWSQQEVQDYIDSFEVGSKIKLPSVGGTIRVFEKVASGKGWVETTENKQWYGVQVADALYGYKDFEFTTPDPFSPQVTAVLFKDPAPKVNTGASGFTVPPTAPTTFSGPLPPGASKTVKKKFVGKKKKLPVTLTTMPDGTFEVVITEEDGDTLIAKSEFDTLSAACDWVWVVQKGYLSAQEYKQKNNTSKVPSGGGWKFWGIDPKNVEAPPPKTTTEAWDDEDISKIQWQEAKAKLPSNAVGFTTGDFIEDVQPGESLYVYDQSGGWDIYTKQEPGDWVDDEGKVYEPHQLTAEITEKEIIDGEVYWVVKKGANATVLDALPAYSIVSFTTKAGVDVKYTKNPDGTWMGYAWMDGAWVSSLVDHLLSTVVANLEGQESTLKIHKPGEGLDTPAPKEDPEQKAIGVLSGGKFDQLKEAGWTVKWVDDLKDGDIVDVDYGVGPITGAKADQLLEAGLVVVADGAPKDPTKNIPTFLVTAAVDLAAAEEENDHDPILIVKHTADDGTVSTKVAKKWAPGKWKFVGEPDYLTSDKLWMLVKEPPYSKPMLVDPTEVAPQTDLPVTSEIVEGSVVLPSNVSKEWMEKVPVGVAVQWTVPGSASKVWTKTKPGIWNTPDQGDIPESVITELLIDASAIKMKWPEEAPEPKPTPTVVQKKIGKATVLVDQSSKLPDAVNKTLKTAFDAVAQWAIPADPNYQPPGAKSSAWVGWVPPPGVAIEGVHPSSGKKYWLITNASGYAVDGKPFDKLKFTIVDEDGNAQTGPVSVNATYALTKALEQAGMWGITGQAAKEMFNLKGTVFAANETLVSIKNGEGPSKVPSASTVIDKPVSAMTDAEKKQPVKKSMTLGDALKTKFPNANVTKFAQHDSYAIHVGTSSLSPSDLKEQVEEFLGGLGLDLTEFQFWTGPSGMTVDVSHMFLDKEVVITTTAEVAASTKSPSPDNWETMPADVPKLFKGSMTSTADIVSILDACPVGTSIDTQPPVTKTSENEWTWPDGLKESSLELAVDPLGADQVYSITPPNSDPAPQAPKPKPPKPTWKDATKDQKDKNKKAAASKKIAAWTKENKPVTDSEALVVLSHFQKLDPEQKFWARTAPDGDLILGAESKKEWATIIKALGGDPGETIDSPLPDKMLGIKSSWYKVSVDDLKAMLPGNPAETVEGPDGKAYPKGTKFTKTTKNTTLETDVAGKVSKITPHKDDPDKVMFKKAGTDSEQTTAFKKLAEEYGLKEPVIITGSNYTMMEVSKEDLQKVVHSEEIITPKVPPQPPAFIAATIPGFGGDAGHRNHVTQNRSDLAVIQSIKPPASGHYIRCGKHGTFWNDQIRVHRFQNPDGKVYYEVSGQLHNTAGVGSAMNLEEFVFEETATTSIQHWDYKEQEYDSETGTVMKGEVVGSARKFEGRGGATASGSKINLVTHSNPAVKGHFRVRIPEGKDVEAELAAAFEVMGVDTAEAMAEPTAEDERLFKKAQVVRSLMGPRGWRLTQSQLRDEAFLDKMLKQHSGVGLAKQATIQVGFNSKQTVMTPVLDKAKKAQCEFVYVSMGTLGNCFARLRAGNGMWSNRSKWIGGIKGKATSSGMDSHGGNSVTFARMGNKKADGKGWGNLSLDTTGIRFVYHPRVLERTDWVGFNSDSFGSWDTNDGKLRNNALGNTASDNEVVFEDGLAHEDLAGMVVSSEGEKKNMVTWLEAEGVTEINGIALADFILVQSGNSRTAIATKLHGLQEGVLP